MASPSKWNWNASNGNATAAQVRAAYQALIGKGPTRNFNHVVWNDIVDKISAQRQAWGDRAWIDLSYLNYTKMSHSGAEATAWGFNQAVENMPPLHDWPWEQTLGRRNIEPGDVCYGVYYIYLTDGLNHWIDLIPLPFSGHLFSVVQVHNTTLIRQAIHVITNVPVRVNSRIISTVAPALHLKVNIPVRADLRLGLPLFTTLPIKLYHIGNFRFYNTVFLAPSLHVKGALAATLSNVGRFFLGDTVGIAGTLTGENYTVARIGVPTVLPVHIDSVFTLTGPQGRLTLSSLHSEAMSAPLIIQHSGYACLIDPDSLAVSVPLDIVQTDTVKMAGVVARSLPITTHFDFGLRVKGGTVVTPNATPVKADMESTLSFPRASMSLITSQPLYISGRASGTLDGTAAPIIKRDITVMRGKAVFEYNSKAEFETIPTFHISGKATMEQTGYATFDADSAIPVFGKLTTEYTNTLTLSTGYPLDLYINTSFNYTGRLTFSTQQYTLVSEIDDILVSDLDDILVDDVEIKSE